MFFDHDRWPEARRLCRRCPVRDECLAHAVAHNEPVGIWGGLTPSERRTVTPANEHHDELARASVVATGPRRRFDDKQLQDLLAAADPDEPAIDAIRVALDLSRSGAHLYLGRARELGAVVLRERRLYPAQD